MRLPFPERIPIQHVFAFASLLAIAQLLEGTSSLFILCSFLFILIAGVTFNLAGGFTRPSGSYIFFYAVLVVIIGLFWKAVLGEPADSNLSAPLTTIEAYLGSMVAMLAATYVSRKLTAKSPLLGTMLEPRRMQNATIGCMIVGIAIVVLLTTFPHPNGSIASALQQLDRFLPMAIILGVVYQIRRSGGTSSVNLPVLLSFAFCFFQGVLGFSKEGMITPFLCWFAAACCLRYRVSVPQIVGGILACVFIFQFLVPYSQYGRNYRSESFSDNFDVATDLLFNIGSVRKQYKANEAETDAEEGNSYYNTPQGFFDRLQMIGQDDSLISYTEQRGAFGMTPIVLQFENLVPHVIWKNKPMVIGGNFYAHEMGTIGENDTTTGISFSPTGEAFHLARWTGVLVIAPILWIGLFVIFDSLCGDLRESPWGILIAIVFAHGAPEGGVGYIIYLYFFGVVLIVFTALTVSYIMPLLGSLVAGPEGLSIRRSGPIRSVPQRVTFRS